MAKVQTAGYEELYKGLESKDGQQKAIRYNTMKDCNEKPVTEKTNI